MTDSQNQLFPIFTKIHQLDLLIVGGGNVAEEKLHFLLKNSPAAQATLIAPQIKAEIRALAEKYENVKLIQRKIEDKDLKNRDLILVATDDAVLNKRLHQVAKVEKTLVNVADTPHLCDFYLGSVVTKGDLKIAISTNGKSPTFAKRFRMVLEEILPDELPEIINQLKSIRDQLKGDFNHKVKRLNEITAGLIEKN
ncbi:MAG: bifunctional precorrin-2 dehydrogenase/sirohydrochlorin ferrochelatase [Chitinophagales bacterium]